MRFLRLDLDPVLTLDPQAPDWAGRRLVRLIAGNPVTMGEMTRYVPDAGSYAPATILIQQMPDGGTRVAYNTVASEIAPHHDAAASQVAQRLDTEVLDLLRQGDRSASIRNSLRPPPARQPPSLSQGASAMPISMSTRRPGHSRTSTSSGAT
jgi:hypothetical protein